MTGLSLGLIETVGLAAAFEAADTCVKSANVTLVGYELTRGDGMAVVKIEGNVDAVKAAIEAARMSAGKVNKVVSTKIIPRPSNQIDVMIKNSDTVGLETEETEETEEIEKEIIEKIEEVQVVKEVKEVEEIQVASIVDDVGERYTCNICKDPKCPRQKGDLRNICIHYKK
mgnify:CR=1 FL=1